jgi:hypothetical protein
LPITHAGEIKNVRCCETKVWIYFDHTNNKSTQIITSIKLRRKRLGGCLLRNTWTRNTEYDDCQQLYTTQNKYKAKRIAIPERETQNMMIACHYTQHNTSTRQNESQYPNERHRIWWLPATIYNKKQVRSRWLPYTREKHKFIIETKLSGKKELEISARNSIMPASVKFEKTYVSSRLLASSALRYRFLSPTIGVVGLIIKSVP